jgi:uncharacterized protein (DUF2252 family)
MAKENDKDVRAEERAATSAREAVGREARKRAPRGSHADWIPAADRPDPVATLQAQDEGRIQQLLPVKYGRMVASPFAFLRGSAAVMAGDLAGTPNSGLEVVLCGDAHLANFGVFASPERRLVFDINDFDEAYPGPWEWDLKRLAASAVVAARENGLKEDDCRGMAVAGVVAYVFAMDKFRQMDILDMWYYHVDVDAVQTAFAKRSNKASTAVVGKVAEKARTRTHLRSLEDVTEVVDGRRQIRSAPPLLVPFRDVNRLAPGVLPDDWKVTEQIVRDAWAGYLRSVAPERRFLLRRYKVKDAALRVGGVGSVGTRCTIALLEGENSGSGLILQQKEAGPSVLEQHLPRRRFGGPATRVVSAQRLMQAASDIFLGQHRGKQAGREFYWRQLKDMKGSFDVTALDKAGFETYVQVCAYCLARAHARTGDPAAIWGYIGTGERFAQAIADFAILYADQTEKDHRALQKAITEGRIRAETGI